MGMKTGWRLAVLSLISATILAAALMSSASAGNSRVYVSNCGTTAYRPHHITVFCGDAGVVVTSIDWNHWGRKSANGKGVALTKTCKPDCASGGVSQDPVSVRLSHRHFCGGVGRSVFLHIDVDYPAGNVLSHSLGCPF
jgi:hypothetical protein